MSEEKIYYPIYLFSASSAALLKALHARHAPLRAPCRENRTLRLTGQTIITSPLKPALAGFNIQTKAEIKAEIK